MNISHITPFSLTRPYLDEYFEKKSRAKILYIYAPMGWGKTTAVASWLERQTAPFQWFSMQPQANDMLAQVQQLQSQTEKEKKKKINKIFVFDDFQHIAEPEMIEAFLTFVKKSPTNWHFIVLSRGPLTKEWQPFLQARQLQQIERTDLAFCQEEIFQYFLQQGISLPQEAVDKIANAFAGWPLAMPLLWQALQKQEGSYQDNVLITVQENLYQYLDEEILAKLPSRQQMFLLRVAPFFPIVRELALIVTAQADSEQLLTDIVRREGFIQQDDEGAYHIAPFGQEYLIARRQKRLTSEERCAIWQNAGLWYETQGLVESALNCYLQGGAYLQAQTLLELIAQKGLGTVTFYPFANYYLALPKEQVASSPLLCCALAMIHSARYQISEAEKWRAALKLFTKEPEKKQLAQKYELYLAAALPYLGERPFIRTLVKAAEQTVDKYASTVQLGLVNYGPSLLRGARDFSHYGQHIVLISQILGPYLDKFWGHIAAGLCDIAAAEIYYEKNQLQEAFVAVTKGFAACEKQGCLEMLLIGGTVLSRLMLASGQGTAYQDIMSNVKQRLLGNPMPELLHNWQAIWIRFQLLEGNVTDAEQWLLQEAPDENNTFSIWEHYCYVTKILVYLALEKYQEALHVLEMLQPYEVDYHRKLDLIENLCLQAAALSRLDKTEDALNRLGEALSLAQFYQYSRVFADQGDIIYRLLLQYTKKKRLEKPMQQFLQQILEESKKYASFYPQYLTSRRKRSLNLTKTEREILLLLARNFSNKEICDTLHITVNTVKFHTKNIYSKLGVKNRVQAVRQARENRLF